jgi:drug/metabolite transporter (DMT)-like permease
MARRGWILFLAMSVIWGLPYLLIRVAVRDVSPPTLVFARTAVAAVILLPFALRRGYFRPLLPYWRWIVCYSVVELAVPWLLLSRAEQHLSSSFAGLLVASVPLASAIIYRFVPGTEHLTGRRAVGLFVGLAGVGALVGIDVGSTDLAAVGQIGIVAVGYSLGPLIISRKLAHLPGLGVVTASVCLTALAYAPWGLTHLPRHVSGETVAAVAGLGIICTALAFVLFFMLILEVGPARSTIITYFNPAVAVLLGVGLLGESFTASMAIGFPLIIVGSALATSGRPAPTATPSGAEGRASPPAGRPSPRQ